MKNRGTKEGNAQEKIFVKDFNRGVYRSFINKYFDNKKMFYALMLLLINTPL